MSFEWFIARRYLTARRRQAFISLISGVSMLGVTVGVMAVIVALALMTGVQRELRDRIVGSTAHVYVWKTGGFGDDLGADMKRLMVPGVIGASPAVMGRGLIETGAADTQPVEVKGIDPAHRAAGHRDPGGDAVGQRDGAGQPFTRRPGWGDSRRGAGAALAGERQGQRVSVDDAAGDRTGIRGAAAARA